MKRRRRRTHYFALGSDSIVHAEAASPALPALTPLSPLE